jgi:hypothetical protein
MQIVVFALSALCIIFITVALAVPLAKAMKLPLPVVVAMIGFSVAALAWLTGIELAGTALDTYDLWFVQSLALNSQSLLLIFLPPLLFEMSLGVNVRRLMDDIWTVFLMAVLAVVPPPIAEAKKLLCVSVCVVASTKRASSGSAVTKGSSCAGLPGRFGVPAGRPLRNRRLLIVTVPGLCARFCAFCTSGALIAAFVALVIASAVPSSCEAAASAAASAADRACVCVVPNRLKSTASAAKPNITPSMTVT